MGQIILGVYITGYCLYAFTIWVRAAEISTERLAPNVIGIYVKGNIDRETSIWMTYDVSMIFLKTIKEPLRFSADGGHLLAGIEIGQRIRLRNFSTFLPPGMRCASEQGI